MGLEVRESCKKRSESIVRESVKKRLGEVEESPLLEAVTREQLVKTQQTEKT
jgi:hypothetical protein